MNDPESGSESDNSDTDSSDTEDDSGITFIPYGYGNRSVSGDPPFAAKDIVIVSLIAHLVPFANIH